jgi:hypothetical protein
MGILDRILGRRPDPTLAWGPSSLPMPDFDVATMHFDNLRFGDKIESAAFLGRPDRFTWTHKDYGIMLYATRGLQLDFEKGGFAYATFFIGPDEHLPKHEGLAFSTPRLRYGTPEGVALTTEMDRPRIEQLFGPPDSADGDSSETVLFYKKAGATMEFELDGASGLLKRWNVYRDDVS